MSERMTAAELRERGLIVGRNGRIVPDETARAMAEIAAQGKPKRQKYGSRKWPGPDGAGGVRMYDSKKSARLAHELELERQASAILAFIPEVSFPVGNLGDKPTRHRVDFLVIQALNSNGSFVGKLLEGKGFDAETGKRKRKALQALTGLRVEVV